jgi:hypothetical protein
MKRLLTLALLASCACSGVPFPEFTPLESESSRLFLHGALASYQSQPRVVERATFEIGRGGAGVEEFALTLYAVCEEPRSLRLAAVSDLGATIFGLVWSSAGLELLHESPNFPEPLLEELARDQAAALFTPDLVDVELVRLEDGRSALYYEDFGSEHLVFLGESDGRLHMHRGEDGELRSMIVLLGDGVIERIDVTTISEAYSARVQVEAWEVGG